jgi:hypothetical protein
LSEEDKFIEVRKMFGECEMGLDDSEMHFGECEMGFDEPAFVAMKMECASE